MLTKRKCFYKSAGVIKRRKKVEKNEVYEFDEFGRIDDTVVVEDMRQTIL